MTEANSVVPFTEPAIARYYDQGKEASRLLRGHGQLELARTRELLLRYLPPAPAVVLDVGGGSGVHACWLATAGFEVHLIDPILLHVEQARRVDAEQPEHPLASVRVGDARQLDQTTASVDAVLLLGPLYHLTERADRLLALREAKRVLRPGGVLFAVGISRFASLLDGLHQGFLDDPAFVAIVEGDLKDGQHRNPGQCSGYFTTAFFHHPEELAAEVRETGLVVEAMLGIEGPASFLHDFDAWWNDPARRERLLAAVRAVECESSLLGLSAHLLVVSRKAGEQPAASGPQFQINSGALRQ